MRVRLAPLNVMQIQFGVNFFSARENSFQRTRNPHFRLSRRSLAALSPLISTRNPTSLRSRKFMRCFPLSLSSAPALTLLSAVDPIKWN